jgi:hypothetical protein
MHSTRSSIRGRRFIHVPLEIRCELLSDVTAELKSHTPLTRFDTTPAELIALAKEFGFEVSAHGGVMAYTQSLQGIVFAVFHHLNTNGNLIPPKNLNTTFDPTIPG